jgi:hypothetical protein
LQHLKAAAEQSKDRDPWGSLQRGISDHISPVIEPPGPPPGYRRRVDCRIQDQSLQLHADDLHGAGRRPGVVSRLIPAPAEKKPHHGGAVLALWGDQARVRRRYAAKPSRPRLSNARDAGSGTRSLVSGSVCEAMCTLLKALRLSTK